MKAEVTANPMSKNDYLDWLDIRIAALKSVKAPKVDTETGELNLLQASLNSRVEVLVSLLYQQKHMVAKLGEGYKTYIYITKPSLGNRIAAAFRGRSYIYTKAYMGKFLGSLRYGLQLVNESMPGEDSAPIRSLQARIRDLKIKDLPRARGLVKLAIGYSKIA